MTTDLEPGQEELICLMRPRAGHFRLGSGDHGELWLDTDCLFARPAALARFVPELARRLVRHGAEAVCGPLPGGAFLAQAVAAELECEFLSAERLVPLRGRGVAPARYRIPDGLRSRVRGKRVGVVDDVLSDGAAARAVLADLMACRARPVAVGALVALGEAVPAFASLAGLPCEALARLPERLWPPADCPLCACGVPLEDAAGCRAASGL